MQKIAVLLGADPVKAAKELKQSLLFEIKLANASLPRELRRNASKLYHPMELHKVDEIAPIVNFTEYVNKILTEDVIQGWAYAPRLILGLDGSGYLIMFWV